MKNSDVRKLERLWKILGGIGLLLLTSASWSGANSKSLALPLSQEIRIGDHWDKAVLTAQLFNSLSDAVKKLVQATAKVEYQRRGQFVTEEAPGATLQVVRPSEGSALYLGKFQGEHLMMSNFHVMHSQEACNQGVVIFEDFKLGQKKKFFCKELWLTLQPGSPDQTDVSFFTIDAKTDPLGVPGAARRNEKFLKNREISVDFQSTLLPGTQLAQAGYGRLRDIPEGISVQHAKDCYVVSRSVSEVLVRRKEGLRKVEILSVGCDGAKGDSGSGLMDLASGKLVGLFVGVAYVLDAAGKPTNQNQIVQSSTQLAHITEVIGPQAVSLGTNSILPTSDIGKKLLARLDAEDSSGGPIMSQIARDGLRELLKR